MTKVHLHVALRKNDKTGTTRLPPEEVTAARVEATRQVALRDLRRKQAREFKELELATSMLDNDWHPLWWAIAYALAPFLARDDEGAADYVRRVIKERGEEIRTAFAAAKGPYILPLIERLSGEDIAAEGESVEDVLGRILLERGASSYQVVRVLGNHDARVQSAGLPQAEVRAARRRARRLRAAAAKKHAELVAAVVPHKPLHRGPVLDQLNNGLVGLLDGVLRKKEKQQAEIVKNIDRGRRRGNRPEG